MARPDVVVLKGVRLGFPKLWHAERATESSAPKYSAHGIIDPSTATGKAITLSFSSSDIESLIIATVENQPS